MPISDADRAYMSVDWRWLEAADTDLLDRHPNARQAEYGTVLMDVSGAPVAMTLIQALTDGRQRLIVATIDGVPADPSDWFKGRPRTVRIYHDRFGGDPVNGKLMMVEQANVDHYRRRTTLHLIG